MFGFRTPAKESSSKTDSSPREEGRKKMTKGAGPLEDPGRLVNTNVRRSVGEIEARRTPPRSEKPELQLLSQQEERAKVRSTTGSLKLTFTQKTSSEGKSCPQKNIPESTETERSPKTTTPATKYKSRTAEAKACLIKAKLQMEKSRNLKSDIKSEVLEAVERLYALVKEAEATATQKTVPVTPSVLGMDPILSEIRDVRAKITELKSEVQENAKLIKESTTTITTAVSSAKTTVTYAEKVGQYQRSQTAALMETPSHSIIVASEIEADTSDDVIKKIRAAVEAKSSGIRVDKVRKAKDGKVIVSCKEKEEITRVMDRLKKSNTRLHTEETKNKDPLVIIRDVLTYNTDEDIIASLRSQNAHILGEIKNEDFRALVKYRRRARNTHENHVVLQVSPQIWQKLTTAGKVHIDLQRVSVQDQSPLIQCTKCLGYGHGKKLCKETEEVCSHCAGPHMRAACPSYLLGEVPICRNCQAAKMDRADHHSFYADCPIRKRWDAIARSSVAYC